MHIVLIMFYCWTYFDQESLLWLRQSQGKAITQFKIAGLLNQAYLSITVLSNAINSFKKIDIHVFNPHVFEESDLDIVVKEILPTLSCNHSFMFESNTDNL